MRIKIPCVECAGEPGSNPGAMRFFWGEFDEEGRVRLTCNLKHETVVIWDAPRHQILLQSAAMAYLGGFANEAIAVLNTALERAYEFYIRVICRAKELSIDAAWKQVAAQSERQVGAFVFLYLLSEGSCPPPAHELAAIRNRVVHRGEIANSQTAAAFGEEVFKRIRQIEEALKKHAQHARAELDTDLAAQERTLPPMRPTAVARVKMTSVEVRGDQVVGEAATFHDFVASLREARMKNMA